MRNKLVPLWLGLLLATVGLPGARAWVPSSHESIWLPGTLLMELKLGEARFNNSAQGAINTWNSQLGLLQLSSRLGSGGQEDGKNDLYFAADYEGQDLGDGVLGVTFTYTYRAFSEINQIFEADIVFNTDYTWELYSGPPVYDGANELIPDFFRVALHELGHVLGLGHPDENGQSVHALMNSYFTEVNTLTNDDIAGGQNLYRAPGDTTPPDNDHFAHATTISLSSGTILVTGENYYATKEAGEPDHDPGDGSGGQSVWWRWTAPGNGDVTLSTKNSTFDTLLGVYTGTAVNALTAIAVNDDDDAHEPADRHYRYSRVDFTAAAGTTYYIAVDGWDAESGLIKLNLSFTPVVNTPPSFSFQPASVTVTEGQAVQFSVTATGIPSPTYQWQRLPSGGNTWLDLIDGGNYSGTGTATLTVNSPTLAMSNDQFRARATNIAGSAISTPALLIVNSLYSLPTIVNDGAAPGSVGGYSTYWAYADGTPSPSYQWQRLPSGGTTWINLTDNLYFSGCNTAELTLVTLAQFNGDQFRCVISNSSGTVTSTVRTISIATPANALAWVSIDFPSQGATGSQVTGSATVINAGTQTWGANHKLVLYDYTSMAVGSASLNGLAPGQKNTVSITFSVPYVPGVSSAYNLRAREDGVGDFGENRSFGFLTYGAAIPPNIVTQPVSQSINTDSPVTFSVLAIGQTPFSYQWYHDGSPVTGATSATLTIANVQDSDAGDYTVRVTNALGFAISNSATLTVVAPPGVVSIAAGGDYSMMLRNDANRWALGYNYRGQFGDGTINSANKPKQVTSNVALIDGLSPEQSVFAKLDGTLWASGLQAGLLSGSTTQQQLSPVPVVNGTDVAAIATGYSSTYFIKTDGTLWAASSPNTSSSTPIQLDTDIAQVSAGNNGYAYVIRSDDSVWVLDSTSTSVSLFENAKEISVGVNQWAVLGMDGSLWEQGVVGTTLNQVATNVVRMSASGRHLMFIKSDGTLWGMGRNSYGQLGKR